MNCKLCDRPIRHTFASFFLQKKIHLQCEKLLMSQEHIVAYPFLEGIIMVTYLFEEQRPNLDQEYFIRNYMTRPIYLAIKQETLILFLEKEVSQEDLYLIFLLGHQRLCWVFMIKPDFLL